MTPRHVFSALRRPLAAGLALWALTALVPLSAARADDEIEEDERLFPHAGNARLLSSDEAAPIKHLTIGLQRTAIPLALGIAVDTSLLADIATAANVGVRWGAEWGIHRFVIGGRYTWFLGGETLSGAISEQVPEIQRVDVNFSGPSVYALYGIVLGRFLVQGEVRHYIYQNTVTTATGAVVFNIIGNLSAVGELGVRFSEGMPLRGAFGLRYGGPTLGLSLGLAYVDVTEPLLPYNEGRVPFLPAFDLSLTF
ncbi:hypothetical protein ACN28S_53060 [Cystobacter fuscus]